MRDTIVPQLQHLGAPLEGWSVEGPVFHNRNGWLFKASHPAARFAVAIKVQNPEVMPQVSMPRHYSCLEHYFSAMPRDAGLAVPEPVLLDQHNNTMAMQWISDPRMSRALLRSGMNAGKRRREFRKAGRWLAAFHAQAPRTSRPLGDYPHLRLADKIAAGIDRARVPEAVNRQLDECLAALEQHYTQVADMPVVCGRRHGDYTPTNLFAGAERVTGIDFLVKWEGPLATDVCRFMAYADVYKYLLTPAGRMDHIGGDRGDLAAFMDGYGDAGILPENHVMTYLQLCETARRIAARANAVAQHGKTAWRLIELHRLTRRGRYLVERLENQTGSPHAER